MKIFVTNLETSKDRRKHIENEFSKLSLEYNFVNCVIGAHLTEEEIRQNCDVDLINEYNKTVTWFTKGILGCTMTNKNTYRKISDEDIPYALLLEDDISLPRNFEKILIHIESFIKEGDVILLNSIFHGDTTLKKSGITSPFNFSYYTPVNYNYISGGSAFIVTRTAAQKMLLANTPIRFTPDDWEFFFNQGCMDRLIIAKPDVVLPKEFRTTMETGKFQKIVNIIEKYRIFPFHQIMKIRRRILRKKMQKFLIVE